MGIKRLNVFGEPWRPHDGSGPDRTDYFKRYHQMRYGSDEAYTEAKRKRAREQYQNMTPEQKARKAEQLRAWKERKRNERRGGSS